MSRQGPPTTTATICYSTTRRIMKRSLDTTSRKSALLAWAWSFLDLMQRPKFWLGATLKMRSWVRENSTGRLTSHNITVISPSQNLLAKRRLRKVLLWEVIKTRTMMMNRAQTIVLLSLSRPFLRHRIESKRLNLHRDSFKRKHLRPSFRNLLSRKRSKAPSFSRTLTLSVTRS